MEQGGISMYVVIPVVLFVRLADIAIACWHIRRLCWYSMYAISRVRTMLFLLQTTLNSACFLCR